MDINNRMLYFGELRLIKMMRKRIIIGQYERRGGGCLRGGGRELIVVKVEFSP